MKEGNVLFNNALNTFYLWLYGVRHMVKDHSDSMRGNLLLPLHGLLFQISSKGSFIGTTPDRIAHTTTFVSPVVEHWLEWLTNQFQTSDVTDKWTQYIKGGFMFAFSTKTHISFIHFEIYTQLCASLVQTAEIHTNKRTKLWQNKKNKSALNIALY